jgi:hypothetical protein
LFDVGGILLKHTGETPVPLRRWRAVWEGLVNTKRLANYLPKDLGRAKIIWLAM